MKNRHFPFNQGVVPGGAGERAVPVDLYDVIFMNQLFESETRFSIKL